MPALYQASVAAFLTDDDDLIIGRLSSVAGLPGMELAGQQQVAWREQISILRSALVAPACLSWHLLLEYPIPRRGKRIDAVILVEDLILVIEFKCGATTYARESRQQVEDYCLDLRDFHQESNHRTLVPILVATRAEDRPAPPAEAIDCVAQLWLANGNTLAAVIEQAATTYGSSSRVFIDPVRWDTAEYMPTPTIVEAAQVLYEGQNVHEITRCHAGADNLTKTSMAVMLAVERARKENQKLICFVTGVPGSGKTLAGLNIVHNRELHQGALGVFLSGNGPLVKVLSEALARDHAERSGQAIGESRRVVSTFIQNVHRFIDAHFARSDAPPDRVVVFDEAQRAWNKEQCQRKFKRDRSEPEIMLDIMNRHEGWAVIVALVGVGQEINTGEAGLGEWGRALAEHFPDWTVLVSPHAVKGGFTANVDLLFDARPNEIALREDDALHLEVCLRSYRAQAVSEFVSHSLLQRVEDAKSALASCGDFPLCMTRDFQTLKEWLKRRQRGTRRIGLIASSGGRRLRALGLDVRSELDVENWFLNPSSDVRSSYYLEAPATEFGIQGLELDWTGVCWDLDLVPVNGAWQVQAFKGTRWQTVHDASMRRYVINKYRVLLTRAREGMIVWVPKGDSTDATRPTSRYNALASFLSLCGIPEI